MRFERGAVSGLCRARAARSGGSRDRCTTCPDNVRRSEGGRPRSGGDRGAALIDPCLQLGILARLVDVPHLHHGRRNMPLARRQLVSIARRRRDASGAAVVAHLVDGDVVDYRLVVRVVDNRRVDIVDRRVVPELVAFPATAFKALAHIAAAVIDSAVEPHVRTPIPGVKQKHAATPTPIPGRPEHADLRRHDPGSGNPKISFPAIAPIAGRPQVTGLRTRRLLIVRQRRRRLRGSNFHLRFGIFIRRPSLRVFLRRRWVFICRRRVFTRWRGIPLRRRSVDSLLHYATVQQSQHRCDTHCVYRTQCKAARSFLSCEHWIAPVKLP